MYKANKLFLTAVAIILFICIGFNIASANTQTTKSTRNTKIELTTAENAFIKAHPVIKFGTDESWPPYVIKDADRGLQGFDVDMLKYINKTAGTNIQLVTGQWKNIVQKAKTHEIDGLTTSAPLKERIPFFNFSKKYATDFPIIIVKFDSPIKLTKLAELSGKTIAIQKANGIHTLLLKDYPDINIIDVKSEVKAIAMVVEGKADAAFASTSTYGIIQKYFLDTIKIAYVIADKPTNLVFSIRKDWPELQSIINKALAVLPRETRNKIYSQWFGFNVEEIRLTKMEKLVDLTFKEKLWIKNHPEIRIGIDPTWHPIEFIDKKGNHQGISSEYVKILNRRLGINMKIIPNLSWAQIMKSVPHKDVDVLPGVAKTSDREKHLNYTKPYIYIDWVILSRTETPRINNLSELEGITTAVDRGYPSHSRMQNQYPKIPLCLKDTTVEVLRSVIQGEAKAAIVEKNTAIKIIQGYRMYTLKIDNHVFQQNDPIAFAVRNDWPELVQILDKGLASIKQDKRDAIHQKWMAVPIHIGFTIQDVITITLLILFVMGIFLMAFLFWNRRLQKEVNIRIKTEKALEDSNLLMKIGESVANLGFFEHNWQTENEIWSDGLYRLIGIDNQNEQVNIQLANFIHNNDKQRVNEHMQKALHNKTSMDIEFQLVQKNGDIIDVHGMGINSYNEQGEPQITRGTLQNISERKQADNILKKCLDTTSSSIGIAKLDDGTMLYLNNRYAEMLGWEKSELAEKKHHENDMYYDLNKRDKLHRKLQNEKMFRDEEVILKNKSGKLIHGLLSATILDGERFAFSIYDITERKQSETMRLKLEQQTQQAQRLESIGTLAGGIAHDFNNMLGVVFGNISYLLAQFKSNEELVEVLSEVMEQAKNAQNLTQQLLTFSKGGAPIKTVIDLNSLIIEAAKFVTRGAKAKCEIDLAKDLWITEVDPGQFNQVISNIIINANQAMPEGGIIKIITENIELEAENMTTLSPGRYVKIGIKDQGIGISKKHLLKIFDPYFSTKQTGSGLGLATSFSIIKRHDGHIAVNSEIGKGTTFYIYLPASSQTNLNTTKRKVVEHKGEGKILIMDDEKQILAMAGRMLNRMGYKTEGTINGNEAVKKYSEAFNTKDIFDLVILDLTIPGGMGGAKTIEALIKIDPNVKAIVSSGYSNDPIMSNYTDHGFCGVLPKPYSQSQLAEILNKIFPRINKIL